MRTVTFLFLPLTFLFVALPLYSQSSNPSFDSTRDGETTYVWEGSDYGEVNKYKLYAYCDLNASLDTNNVIEIINYLSSKKCKLYEVYLYDGTYTEIIDFYKRNNVKVRNNGRSNSNTVRMVLRISDAQFIDEFFETVRHNPYFKAVNYDPIVTQS